MNLARLKREISRIGQRMMDDARWGQFDDITYDRKKGILPDCFFLDELEGKIEDREKVVIVTGINPGGRAGMPSKYEDVIKTWQPTSTDADNHYNYKGYYRHLRTLVKDACVPAMILWTELVYCPNAKGKKGLPRNGTIRFSVLEYLKPQLDLFPNAPIVAVGNKAYELLSLIFPDRLVIGVPHPSNASKYAREGRHPYFNEKIFASMITLLRRGVSESAPKALKIRFKKSSSRLELIAD